MKANRLSLIYGVGILAAIFVIPFSLWGIWPEEPAPVKIVDVNSICWDSNLYMFQEETYKYVFDANSDPLTVGRMMIYYFETSSDQPANMMFYVPLKNKAEYDAIMRGAD